MNELASKSRVVLGWKLWVLIFVTASLLYGLTTQRGAEWQDSGAYQWRAMQGEFIGEVPLCRSHPTYIAIGWGILKASGNNLTLLNAFSGLAAAFALANLAAVGVLLTKHRGVTLIAVIALGLSHTFWWLATTTEIYTLVVALLTLNLYLLVKFDQTGKRWLFYALVFVSGLGVSVHNFALLPIPVYFVYFVFMTREKKLRRADWGIAAAIWIIGAAPLLGLSIYKGCTQNIPPLALLHEMLTGRYTAEVMNFSKMSQNFQANTALTALNGINLLWIPAAIGAWTLIRKSKPRRQGWVLLAITLIEIIFFVRYIVPDQFMFVLPSMVMVALLGCIGLGQIVRWGAVGKLACGFVLLLGLLQIPMYVGISKVLENTAYANREVSSDRDEIRYWIIPWKHNENSAEKWATAVMNNVPEGSVIYADTTTRHPLKLKNFLNPSVTVISDTPLDYKEMIRRPDKAFCVSTRKPQLPTPWVMERISPDIKLFHATKPKEP